MLHGILEYVAMVACLLAPFLLDIDSGAARVMCFAAAAGVLLVALTNDGPAALVRRIPVTLHVALDYVLAAVLVLAPFALGFADDDAARNFLVTVGVLHALMTMGTRFVSPSRPHVGSLAAGTSAKLEAERAGR